MACWALCKSEQTDRLGLATLVSKRSSSTRASDHEIYLKGPKGFVMGCICLRRFKFWRSFLLIWTANRAVFPDYRLDRSGCYPGISVNDATASGDTQNDLEIVRC
jgi:hypothetical protein